jgi:hypothetical protein
MKSQQVETTGGRLMTKRLAVLASVMTAMVVAVPSAAAYTGQFVPQNGLVLLGYFLQNGSERYIVCEASVRTDTPNGSNADYSTTSFTGTNGCGNVNGADTTEVYQTGNACLRDALDGATLGCGPGYGLYTMGWSDTGTANRGLTEAVQVDYNFTVSLPGNAVNQTWETWGGFPYSSCSAGIKQVSEQVVTCDLKGAPYEFTPDAPTQYLLNTASSYASYAIGVADSLLGQEESDGSCAASQVVGSPQAPGSNQPLCQNTATAVSDAKSLEQTAISTVNSVLGTVGQVVSKEEGDAQCTESQIVGAPQTPNSTTPVCQTVAPTASLVKQLSGQERSDASCAATQVVGSPQAPGSNQPLCQNTATAVSDAKSLEQTAINTVNSVLGTAGQVVSQEQGDAQCTESQVVGTPQTPNSSQPACENAAPIAAEAKQETGVLNEPPAGEYSNTCTAAGAVIADGYAGNGTYVTLRAQPNPQNSSQEWVCYRLDNPNSGSVGGRLTIGGVSAQAGLPQKYDGQGGACQSAGGNVLLNGTLLSNQFMVADYTPAGQAWMCVIAASVSEELVVPVPGVGSPTVYNQFDASPPPLPAPNADSNPSGTCQNATTGSQPNELANLTAGGVNVWLYEWEPDSHTVDLCAKVQGSSASAGGVLSFSTDGVPGVQPVVTSGGTCSLSIFTLTTPVQASLATSQVLNTGNPLAANPASVCVSEGSTSVAETVGVTGSPVPPTVTWTPDPGTP